MSVNHTGLNKIAKRWLLKTIGCGYVISEVVSSAGETIDALGLRSDYTILIECKTSKADFKADQKKIFRQHPERGMGTFRFYLCEPGVIEATDIPKGWGLLFWNGKKVKRIIAPKGNIWLTQNEFIFEKSMQNEYRIIYSCLRRIRI